MPTIKTTAGAEIYYKDWGSGQPIIFAHGWPLSTDAWEDQVLSFIKTGKVENVAKAA